MTFEYTEAPYSKEEADFLREIGENVYACWWCLFEEGDRRGVGVTRPYWPDSMVVFVGDRLACPRHLAIQKGEA